MAGVTLHEDCFLDLANLHNNNWTFDYNQHVRNDSERLRARLLELELGGDQGGERLGSLYWAYQRINTLEKELRAAHAEKEVVTTQLKGVVTELAKMEQRLLNQQADKDFVLERQDAVSAQLRPCLQTISQLLHALDVVVKQVGTHHAFGQTLSTLHIQIVHALELLQLLHVGNGVDVKLAGQMQQLQALGYALSVSTLSDTTMTSRDYTRQLSQQLSPDSDISSHSFLGANIFQQQHVRGRSLHQRPSAASVRGLSPMSIRDVYDPVIGLDGGSGFGSSHSEYSMSSMPESPSSTKEVIHMEPRRLQELAGPALVVQCAWRAAWVRCKYNRLRREVFVGNLPIKEQVYEDELKAAFSAAGEVETVAVMRNTTGSRGQVGLCRGFGFVRYYSVEDAYNALKMLQGVRFRSRTLRVDRATWRT